MAAIVGVTVVSLLLAFYISVWRVNNRKKQIAGIAVRAGCGGCSGGSCSGKKDRKGRCSE